MVKKYIGWNLLGLVSPAIAAIIVFPILLNKIGESYFGVIAIVWGIVGMAILFDFGIGRTITYKLSAAKLNNDESYKYLKSSEKLAFYITVIFLFVFPLLIFFYLKGIDSGMAFFDVVLSSIIISLISIMQVYASLYRGVNEAYLKFKTVNIIKTIVGVINFVGPCIASLFFDEISVIILPIFLARLLSLFYLKKSAYKLIFNKPRVNDFKVNYLDVLNLVRFGGWISISNICVVLIMQADKLLIGNMIGSKYVAGYAIAYELVIKVMVISGAVSSVMFPLITKVFYENKNKAKFMLYKWILYSMIIMYPFLFSFYYFIEFILNAWIGSIDYVSVTIAKVLIFGVAINIVTNLQYCYLQAINGVKYIATYQVIQLPIVVLMLSMMLSMYGVVGAAYVWVIRVSVDLISYSIIMRKAKSLYL